MLRLQKADQIIDAKYAGRGIGAATVWQGAYHVSGVRDLASLEKGKVASILNADSYNAFAAGKPSRKPFLGKIVDQCAVALMRRVEAELANDQLDSTANIRIPHLHPDAVSRLRKAVSTSDARKSEASDARKLSLSEPHMGSIVDQHPSDRIPALGSWPAPGEVAAAKLTKSDLRRR